MLCCVYLALILNVFLVFPCPYAPIHHRRSPLCSASARVDSVLACRGVPWWRPAIFQSRRWQLPLGPGEHSATDNLASEILGHLKLVLSEFSMIGKLEISHCTLVVTMFIISLLCESGADVCQGEESQFYTSLLCVGWHSIQILTNKVSKFMKIETYLKDAVKMQFPASGFGK